MAKRPDPWLSDLAQQTIDRHHRWWRRVNPACINRSLGRRHCAGTISRGAGRDGRHRVWCCDYHMEVDDHLDGIADVMLTFPHLDPKVRARRFGAFDRRYQELFGAWLDSGETTEQRRLPSDKLVDFASSFGSLAGQPGQARRCPSSLHWLRPVAEERLAREFAYWSALDERVAVHHLEARRSPRLQALSTEFDGHLEEVGLVLLLAPVIGEEATMALGCPSYFHASIERMLTEWMRSNPIPFGRTLSRNGLRRFHEDFGANNPYRWFFMDTTGPDPTIPADPTGPGGAIDGQ